MLISQRTLNDLSESLPSKSMLYSTGQPHKNAETLWPGNQITSTNSHDIQELDLLELTGTHLTKAPSQLTIAL